MQIPLHGSKKHQSWYNASPYETTYLKEQFSKKQKIDKSEIDDFIKREQATVTNHVL